RLIPNCLEGFRAMWDRRGRRSHIERRKPARSGLTPRTTRPSRRPGPGPRTIGVARGRIGGKTSRESVRPGRSACPHRDDRRRTDPMSTRARWVVLAAMLAASAAGCHRKEFLRDRPAALDPPLVSGVPAPTDPILSDPTLVDPG